MDNWAFADPANTGVFISSDVFEQDSPIIRVTHDIDGAWQFWGYGPWEEMPRLVCLEDVVSYDQSVQEVADLPLLWASERPRPTQPWTRQPQYPVDWDAFLDECIDYTQRVQGHLMSIYPIEQCAQYQLDLERDKIQWTNRGHVVVEANIALIGTYSTRSESWRWHWANDHISDQDWYKFGYFCAFGEQNGFQPLSHAQWPATLDDAYEMMAVACYLLQAEGVYHFPYEHCFVYYALNSVQWLNHELQL